MSVDLNGTATLSARVRGGAPLIGMIVKMPGPAIVETAAHCGFDLVVIDTEHGAAGTELLEHHLRAADSAGVPALVRVGSADGPEILRALDAGACGIVVPHVSDAATAERIVRSAHYPARGTRGLATSTRAGHHGLVDVREHIAAAREQTLVVVQIEDVAAVEHVAEIAAVDGVDAIFVGPTDLSLSLGHPGDLDHPDVDAAIGQIVGEVVGGRDAALWVVAGDAEATAGWHGRGAGVVLFAAPALITREFRRVASAAKLTMEGR